jgi:hypothetical protein
MGATSTQGLAVLVFLVAFTFLGASMYAGGSWLYLTVFVVGLATSTKLFLKAKAMQ